MHKTWLRLPAYNPLTPEFAADPAASLARLRSASWAARDPFGISVLRHAEVDLLVRDPRLAEWGLDLWRAQGIVDGELIEWGRRVLPSRGGEEHARLRRRLNPAVARRSIEPLRPRLRDRANVLLDAIVDVGPCELMSAFADPFAAELVVALLGLPGGAELVVRQHAGTLGSAFNLSIGDELPSIESALVELGHLVEDLLRAAPRTPLMQRLVDPALDPLDARALAIEIVESGYDTLRNQLGCALVLLMDHAEQWALVHDEMGLVDSAVDECIRFLPTILAALRVVASEFEIHDVVIPLGSFVSLLTASANRDERVFERPEVFDIRRTARSAHLAFGGGPHTCLGLGAARVAMAEALGALANRRLHLRRVAPVEWRSLLGVRGPTQLLVELREKGL